MTKEQKILSLLARFKELVMDQQTTTSSISILSLPIPQRLRVRLSLRLKTNFCLMRVSVQKVAR